jgi:predicted 3-demethylubiquinone-9 3-methyltransferase (glyoxalase superfamily)
MQKITPFLWFDRNCEEALNFYTSIFENSKIVTIKRYPDGVKEGPMAGMDGKVLTAVFELNGQRFMALDGGPTFKPNEAVSFLVECKDQTEIDYFWNKFIEAGGKESVCGWLKDKYGFSWQIVPDMSKYFLSSDKDKNERAFQAMMKMKKIIIADLENA